MNAPIFFYWDGESMVPMQRHRALCDKTFVVGEHYPLVVSEQRSQASHNHYFAAINQAWHNLPEDVAEQFPSSEHLRKWALIKTGFADEQTVVCDTPGEAMKFAALARQLDEYAVVTVAGQVVRIFRAKSQNRRSMGKKMFNESKQSVLDLLASEVGVKTDELRANAGAAA